MAKYQICISGSHTGKSVESGKILAQELGRAVAKGGHTLLTGATIGLPHLASEAYKKAGGEFSIGISPASSKVEHVMKYRLPVETYDAVLYSGMHYAGRDAFLINSSDAVLSVGGRMGTFHEFAIAVETDTPIGFLRGAGGVSDEIKNVLEATGEGSNKHVVFADSAEELLKKIEHILDTDFAKYRDIYK